MKELSQRRTLTDGLKMELMDDAMDFAFGYADRAFEDMPFDTEEQIQDQAFRRLELKFKNKFEEECIEQKKLWKINTLYDITDGLFHSTLDRAYRNLYRKQEYKESVTMAESRALDKLFFELIDTDENMDFDEDDPWKFEDQLKRKFEQVWESEIKGTTKETGLQQDMSSLLKKAFERKFFDANVKYKD